MYVFIGHGHRVGPRMHLNPAPHCMIVRLLNPARESPPTIGAIHTPVCVSAGTRRQSGSDTGPLLGCNMAARPPARFEIVDQDRRKESLFAGVHCNHGRRRTTSRRCAVPCLSAPFASLTFGNSAEPKRSNQRTKLVVHDGRISQHVVWDGRWRLEDDSKKVESGEPVLAALRSLTTHIAGSHTLSVLVAVFKLILSILSILQQAGAREALTRNNSHSLVCRLSAGPVLARLGPQGIRCVLPREARGYARFLALVEMSSWSCAIPLRRCSRLWLRYRSSAACAIHSRPDLSTSVYHNSAWDCRGSAPRSA